MGFFDSQLHEKSHRGFYEYYAKLHVNFSQIIFDINNVVAIFNIKIGVRIYEYQYGLFESYTRRQTPYICGTGLHRSLLRTMDRE